MNNKIWKPVVGYEGLYEVSSEGNIKSLEKDITYKNGAVHHYQEKMLKPLNGKYLRVCLAREHDWECQSVHVIVAKAFPDICGEYFKGCFVDHISTDKHDNRAVNLRITTPKGNTNNPITISQLRKRNRLKRLKIAVYKEGVLLKTCNSLTEAAEYTGTLKTSICTYFKKGYKQWNGYEYKKIPQ